MQTINRLVDMLDSGEQRVETKVSRFSSTEGISGLGDNPFVSVLNDKISYLKACSVAFMDL